MKKILVVIAAAVLSVIGASAAAAPARSLYEARVQVSNQSPALRDQALQQALAAVLVRVTGSRDLQGADPLLNRAASLVQGYGYEDDPSGRGLWLKAQFDARAVDALLRQQGLPVWGPNRLAPQVWLALRDDGGTRTILDQDAAAARAAALIETANARGVPLTFPNIDATDRQLVSFNELWSGATEGVRGAAQRYNARRILIGRVGREGGRWLGRWTLLADELGEEWTTTGSRLNEVLAAGVHELADREGRRFATQPGFDRDLRVHISGVNSLQDYARTLNYLRGLNPVRSAQVEAARDGTVTFRLNIAGDPASLTRVIAAGRVLRREESGLFESAHRYALVR